MPAWGTSEPQIRRNGHRLDQREEGVAFPELINVCTLPHLIPVVKRDDAVIIGRGNAVRNDTVPQPAGQLANVQVAMDALLVAKCPVRLAQPVA